MSKIILIYANCRNSTARGDFSLAGSIAHDLSEIIKTRADDTEIVLTSTLDGISRYEGIYGSKVDNHVTIDGERIRLCALEMIDPVENTVIAWIEANRCKYPDGALVKRVLSPDGKFLFIGAANQNAWHDPFEKIQLHYTFESQQPGVYTHFDEEDIFIGSSGLGDERLGLPTIAKTGELTELDITEQAAIPTTPYGFMYVAAVDDEKDPELITQYIKLTDLDRYVLVGNFSESASLISSAYQKDTTLTSTHRELPSITYFNSLSHTLVRHMMAHTPSTLVMSTGVMSTLEAMQDNKLTYYQDLSNNTQFVASYLMAMKSIIDDDSSLTGCMPQLLFELASMLFADKPLSPKNMERTHELLTSTILTTRLIEKNRAIVANASGKLAPRLLSFIGREARTSTHGQLARVCMSLKKPGETSIPLYAQALRRAAYNDLLFELKVLLKSLNSEEASEADAYYRRNALHWAVIKQSTDCVKSLLAAHVSLNDQDMHGRTPIHYAIESGNRLIMKALIEAGAALDIPDENIKTPLDFATEDNLPFIENCKEHLSAAMHV